MNNLNSPPMLLLVICILCFIGCKKEESNPIEPSSIILTDGLVGYYSFDSRPVHVNGFNDNGFAPAPPWGPTSVPDRFGFPNKALSFDGIDDSLIYPTNHFAEGNNLSVSLWANIPYPWRYGGMYFVICSDFGVFSENGTIGLAISLPSTNNARGEIPYNKWIHFVGTYNGTTIKAYINGELKDSTIWAGNLYERNWPLSFGYFGRPTSDRYWSGTLDDVRIYNRVVSQQEIEQLYHEGG
jgi:hypothetical protein